MAVYGGEFLEKVDEIWGSPDTKEKNVESSRLLPKAQATETTLEPKQSSSLLNKLIKGISWYLLLMPVWCFVADLGKKKLKMFREKEALKSPHINRLGKVAPIIQPQLELQQATQNMSRAFSGEDLSDSLLPPSHGPKVLPYGAVGGGGNKAIGAAILARQSAASSNKKSEEDEDETDIAVLPTWWDFGIAIFFIAFGVLALTAGMISILMTR